MPQNSRKVVKTKSNSHWSWAEQRRSAHQVTRWWGKSPFLTCVKAKKPYTSAHAAVSH